MAASEAAPTQPILTADGTPLKQALKRSQKAERRRAFMLVAPLLFFLFVVFVVPIIAMIWRSVYNPEVRDFLPHAAAALNEWHGDGIPPESVFEALASDMVVSAKNRTLVRVAARINREIPGALGMMMRTARKADKWSAPYREKFLDADKRWKNPDFWRIMKRDTRLLTPVYYLLAIDYEYKPDGSIGPRPPDYRVYRGLFSARRG